MKPKPPFNINAAIRSAIRRVFSRSPMVRDTMMKVRREVPKFNKDGTRAKKDAVQYLCGVCNEYVSSTKIAVDHKIPVIDVDKGFVDWNTFVDRVFCDLSNLQVICDPCHQAKTNSERFERQFKRDIAVIDELEKSNDMVGIAIAVKKISKKRLSSYPEDIRARVDALKQKIRGIKIPKK